MLNSKPIIFNELQKQILLGSLLGDGGITKITRGNYIGYCYKEAHSRKQEEYLLWKNKILGFNYSNKDKYGKVWIYRTNKIFEEYYHLFYRKNKKYKIIDSKILNNLNVIGLSIWFMDDGHYSYSNNNLGITLGIESLEISISELGRFFIDKFGIVVKVYKFKDCYRIIFNFKEGKKFISLIRKFIHPTLYYKLGEDKLRMERHKNKASISRKKYWAKNKEKLNTWQREDYEKRREYHSLRKKKSYMENRILQNNSDKNLQHCSNCGKLNKYRQSEYKSRQETLCKHCGHSLSICFFIDEGLINEY